MTDEQTRAREALAEQIGVVFRKVLEPYVHDLSRNMNRAETLINSASDFRDRSVADDILRAVVVFNHAYLEDFLRTLARELLPQANEASLDDIPLAGLGSSRRAGKFSLGKLAYHRGKLVEEVIRESVSGYLDHSTFNSISDIAQLLTTLDFRVSEHNQEFPKIEKMLQRRHQIVHRADKVNVPNSDVLQSIDISEVRDWLQGTANFARSVMGALALKLYPPEKIAEMFKIRIVQK